MRKKELLKLNHELYGRLEKSESECAELTEENRRLRQDIEKLQHENEKKATSGIHFSENTSEPNGFITEDVQYAAQAIGRTVIEAARLCGRLSAVKNSENAHEQINLILGRTEVTKSEILETVFSDKASELKRSLIDEECLRASDYFSGVMAQ